MRKGERTLGGKVVIEYMRRFPNTSNRELARKIYNENGNNLLFKDTESVRTTIRLYKGSQGEALRKYKLKLD
jgi:hypothetical protein